MNKKVKTEIKMHRAEKMVPERCGIKFHSKQKCKAHTFALHRHNFLEIEYMISGEFESDVCGNRLRIGRGDFYCLGLNDYHGLEIKEGSSLYSLTINYKAMPPVLQQLIKSRPFPLVGHFPEDECGEIDFLFSTVGRLTVSSDPFAEEKLTAYAILLFCKLFDHSSKVNVKKSNSGYRHVTRAIDYIDEHFKDRVTLDAVARAVYLSPNHFSKLFSEINGVSFSDHLSRVRIEYAKKELLLTEKPVTDIALDCGFSSFSSFSRNFKRLCGCTPSEFRSEENEAKQ